MKKIVDFMLTSLLVCAIALLVFVNIDMAFGITAPHYEVFDGISVTTSGVEKHYKVVCDRRQTIGYQLACNWSEVVDENLGTECVSFLNGLVGS